MVFKEHGALKGLTAVALDAADWPLPPPRPGNDPAARPPPRTQHTRFAPLLKGSSPDEESDLEGRFRSSLPLSLGHQSSNL